MHKKQIPVKIRWKYVRTPEEDHMTILARSLIEGHRAFGSNEMLPLMIDAEE